MLPRDRGSIVQVGSALAYRGIPLQAAYCGAKHAIVGFTESLRLRVASRPEQGARFDGAHAGLEHAAVQLGEKPAAAPRQPVPPIYQPEVAARAIHYSAHHHRRQMFVGLSTAVVIEGNKIAPGLAIGIWPRPATTRK